MLPVLQIGPLALQTSGLILLLGLWASLSLTEWFASRRQTQASGLNPNKLYNLALGVLAAGLVGARLSYVIRYPPAFIQSPLSIFSLNPGLLDPWGGFVAALVTSLIYGNRKGLSFWPTLDAFTPAFAVLALAVSLSHVASGQAFGVPADLPWAIELWGARRHPSQVYETIAAVLILWAIWPGRIKRSPTPAGWRFLTFLELSAGACLFLEAFRADSLLLPGGLRLAQVAAWFVMAVSLYGLMKIQSIVEPILPEGK